MNTSLTGSSVLNKTTPLMKRGRHVMDSFFSPIYVLGVSTYISMYCTYIP